MTYTAAMLYEERTQEIRQQLARLDALLSEHQRQADGRINYAHAGDLSYVRQELNTIINFLEGKDD